MRDPKRIPIILKKIKHAWIRHGTDQLRLGQFIINIASLGGYGKDQLWNIEDDEWEKMIDKWNEKYK